MKAIDITTYEIDENGEANPTLMHRFYGKTLKEALGTAKAHLITDAFFSASFIGEMPWHDFVLKLENEIDVDSSVRTSTKLYKELETRAYEIQKQKKKIGLIELIQKIK